MENKDQPINPLVLQQVDSNEYRYHRDKDDFTYTKQFNGLTKREYFAGLAMPGFCAACYGDFNDDHKARIADLAIKQADELLKQLNT